MYIFVSIEEKRDYYKDGSKRELIRVRLEQASGERCLLVPYEEFDMSVVEEIKPSAIAVSGFAEPGRSDGFKGIREVFQKAGIPMICFCGSHQLIDGCLTHGFGDKSSRWKPEPMRKITKTEDFPRVPSEGKPYDRSAYFLADGFFPVTKVKDDPIFKGLPNPMIMKCLHYCEVKKMPAGFELLASSGHSRIAMIRHESRIFYGTQFHPEAYAKPFMHGQKMLKNFACIVRDFWK